MSTPNDVVDENEIMVPCRQCTNPVWVRKDRLQMHLQKVHSPKAAPKKSFTTYKAKIVSSFPPKVTLKAATAKPVGLPDNALQILLGSRDGQRIGKGICAECGVEQISLWHYAESNRGAVDLCSGCKPHVFDRSFG
jgi:hypothetical protein